MNFNDVFLNEDKGIVRKFEAPQKVIIPEGYISIFLAGSIDMGKAEDWQTKVGNDVVKNIKNIIVINPRRKDWDSSWKQEITNKKFNEQVTWELSNIERSDILLYVFTKDSQAPITLAELGIGAGKFPEKCIVYCPEGFYRKGNVDIICHRYGIDQIESLDDIVPTIIKKSKNEKDKNKNASTKL